MAIVSEKVLGRCDGHDIVEHMLTDDGGKTFYTLKSKRLKPAE